MIPFPLSSSFASLWEYERKPGREDVYDYEGEVGIIV